MPTTKLSNFLLLLAVCSAAAGCTSNETGNTTASTNTAGQTPASTTNQAQLDPRIVTWLGVCQANGQEPYIEGLFPQCTATESIRALVKEKYGGLKAANFCQYFASPDFANLEKSVLSKPVVVTVVPSLEQALAGTYPPNSIVVYVDDHDPFRYSYDKVDDVGKAGKSSGGSDVIEH